MSELKVSIDTTGTDPNNPDAGDLYLTGTGQEVVETDLAKEVAQRIMARLNIFRGEWFLDLDAGTPWFQTILGKKPDDRLIRMVFDQVITGTQGVQQLLQFGYRLDRRTRSLSVSFRAQLENGAVFSSADFGRFFVTLDEGSEMGL